MNSPTVRMSKETKLHRASWVFREDGAFDLWWAPLCAPPNKKEEREEIFVSLLLYLSYAGEHMTLPECRDVRSEETLPTARDKDRRLNLAVEA